MKILNWFSRKTPAPALQAPIKIIGNIYDNPDIKRLAENYQDNQHYRNPMKELIRTEFSSHMHSVREKLGLFFTAEIRDPAINRMIYEDSHRRHSLAKEWHHDQAHSCLDATGLLLMMASHTPTELKICRRYRKVYSFDGIPKIKGGDIILLTNAIIEHRMPDSPTICDNRYFARAYAETKQIGWDYFEQILLNLSFEKVKL